MTKLLALETVFAQCSVALLTAQTRQLIADPTIVCLTKPSGRGQTEMILPMIDSLLKAESITLDQLQVLAFNRGPGAFSGIRINAAAVQALGFAYDLPCVAVSSLEALAFAACQNIADVPVTIAAVIDAKQNEIYACRYRWNGEHLKALDDEQLLPYGRALVCDYLATDAIATAALVGGNFLPRQVQPTASDIALLAYHYYKKGMATECVNALPVYLRQNAWKTLTEQGRG